MTIEMWWFEMFGRRAIRRGFRGGPGDDAVDCARAGCGAGARRGHGRPRGASPHRGGRWTDTGGTLLALRPGEEGRVGHIGDDRARAEAVRFGIGRGALVRCITALPGGPVVLRAGRQEIAIGRGLASRIEVQPVVAVVAESA